MANPRNTKHWWQDQFARLVITIIGGVAAAIILLFLIPALQGGEDGTDGTETDGSGSDGSGGSDAPADSGDAPVDESPDPAPAEEGLGPITINGMTLAVVF